MLSIKTTLIKTVTSEAKRRRPQVSRDLRRAVCCEVHRKQYEEAEDKVADALARVFHQHIREAAKRLREMVGSKDAATDIVNQLIDQKQATKDIINAALPILAKSMAEAAMAEWIMAGMEPKKQEANRITKTTATEWLDDMGIDLPPGLSTEWPDWMLDAISESLREAFDQPWWEEISETTASDIEQFLRVGFAEGESLRDLAGKIHEAFPEEYSKKRGMLVARTEAGHALNAARDLSIQHLKEELGEAGATIGKSWLSVLGNTTRDSHAALDGTLADAEGLWNLSGYMVPWPAHFSLPPGERCNCRCTILTEYGIDQG